MQLGTRPYGRIRAWRTSLRDVYRGEEGQVWHLCVSSVCICVSTRMCGSVCLCLCVAVCTCICESWQCVRFLVVQCRPSCLLPFPHDRRCANVARTFALPVQCPIAIQPLRRKSTPAVVVASVLVVAPNGTYMVGSTLVHAPPKPHKIKQPKNGVALVDNPYMTTRESTL